GGEQATQQDVLAAPFDTASPALVAGDVDHRREGPVDPRPGRFERGGFGGPAGEIRFEARHFGEWDRKDGAVTVDDVARKNQRDLHPRFFDRSGLQDPRHGRAVAVEYTGQLATTRLLDLLLEIWTGTGRIE